MNDNTLESRLIEMEIKVSFQEATLEALSSVLQQQQKDIERLSQQLEELKSGLEAQPETVGPQEKPPHY